MSVIACPSCGKVSPFDNGSGLPIECPFCFEDIDQSVNSSVPKRDQEVAGLTLVYQINQERLEIPALGKTILGRDGFGASLLAKIVFNGKQVISRRHCSIEFRENKFYLQDEGSLNGTYYSSDKIDCKHSAQIIQDESLVYLGEEPFLAKVQSRRTERPVENKSAAEGSVPSPRNYRCNESMCGYETESPPRICPQCKAFNSFVSIHR
jgi:phage FluMu protein Com